MFPTRELQPGESPARFGVNVLNGRTMTLVRKGCHMAKEEAAGRGRLWKRCRIGSPGSELSGCGFSPIQPQSGKLFPTGKLHPSIHGRQLCRSFTSECALDDEIPTSGPQYSVQTSPPLSSGLFLRANTDAATVYPYDKRNRAGPVEDTYQDILGRSSDD